MTSGAVGAILMAAAVMGTPCGLHAQTRNDGAGASVPSPTAFSLSHPSAAARSLWRVGFRPRAEPGAGSVGLPAPTPPDHWLAPDKLRHFFLSFGATGVAWTTLDAARAGDAADWLAPSLTMMAGLAKEIVDHGRGWGFSLKDLVWDAAGVFVAMVAMRETG